jgi:hypothetical protein
MLFGISSADEISTSTRIHKQSAWDSIKTHLNSHQLLGVVTCGSRIEVED